MRTMRVLKPWASFSCVVMALFLVATQYVGTGRGSPPTEPLQVEEGREAFGQACVQCHGMSRTQIPRKTADGWRNPVYSMISRGAPVMPDEIEPLIDYLSATYGPGATPPAVGGEVSQAGSALPDGPAMTPETKKSAYWTGGALAALVVVVAILWAAGILQTPPAQ